MLVRHVNPTPVGTFRLDFFLLFCTLVSNFSGFNSLHREFVETDNCGPPLPRFTPNSGPPLRILLTNYMTSARSKSSSPLASSVMLTQGN